jgi:HEAT repeat protein
MRASLQDADPEVRWAAVQLLFNIRDPQVGPLVERMLSEDPDPELRVKIISLYKGREETARLGPLVRGLQDVDMSVRLASLRTLGRFQDKRKEEFKALAEKLRTDYEEAVRRSAGRR